MKTVDDTKKCVRRIVTAAEVKIPARHIAKIPVKLQHNLIESSPECYWLTEPAAVNKRLLTARVVTDGLIDCYIRVCNPTDTDAKVGKNGNLGVAVAVG